MKSNQIDSMKQAQQARAQNLKKWREQRLHEETLPSGLEVVLRDVDLASVFIEGDIPNTLITLITGDEFQQMKQEEAGKKLVSEHKTDFDVLMKHIITAALVEPLIGAEPDDEHILYGELTLEDKMFIFNFANREADQVRSFREGTAEPVPTASAS